MTTRPESARNQDDIHNTSDKIRKEDSYRRTIHDLRADVLVIHAKSTR